MCVCVNTGQHWALVQKCVMVHMHGVAVLGCPCSQPLSLYRDTMIDRMGIGLLEGIFGRVEGILGSWQVCPDWGVM